MYCRYCGKVISDDSQFCNYCGKSLANTSSINVEKVRDLTDTPSRSDRFIIILKALNIIALCLFLLLNILMAPFWGWLKGLAYIIEAIIAIILSLKINDIASDNSSLKKTAISLIFCITFIITLVSLKAVYDYKYDTVQKNITNSSSLLIDIKSNTDYYSTYYLSYGGIVTKPYTKVKVNGKENKTKVDLSKPLLIEIQCGGNGAKASTSNTVALSKYDFYNGEYSEKYSLYLEKNLKAEIEIVLKKHSTFWEVIFY